MSKKLNRAKALLELDLAEKCDGQVSCKECQGRFDCKTYRNLDTLYLSAISSSKGKEILVHYTPNHSDELHVSVRKEDFDDLVERANNG